MNTLRELHVTSQIVAKARTDGRMEWDNEALKWF
jgi:hypothetical protein